MHAFIRRKILQVKTYTLQRDKCVALQTLVSTQYSLNDLQSDELYFGWLMSNIRF
jgi:hypothetical protein